MPTHFKRLTPLERSTKLLPWRHASQFENCFLYWAPLSRSPVPAIERRWQLAFLALFVDRLEQTRKIIADTFVDARMVMENQALLKVFTNSATEFLPLIGFARVPGAKIPEAAIPAEDLEAFARRKRKAKPLDYLPSYCYWFRNRSGERQRELFFGYGGMTLLFMQPDPKTAPPPELAQLLPFLLRSKMLAPLREKFDIERIVMSPNPLAGDFRDRSKTVFGGGMEANPEFQGMPFIIPRLKASDYFQAPPEVLEAWFSVFHVYLRESPEDGGLLLASKEDLQEDLLSILDRMRSEGNNYPEWIVNFYASRDAT